MNLFSHSSAPTVSHDGFRSILPACYPNCIQATSVYSNPIHSYHQQSSFKHSPVVFQSITVVATHRSIKASFNNQYPIPSFASYSYLNVHQSCSPTINAHSTWLIHNSYQSLFLFSIIPFLRTLRTTISDDRVHDLINHCTLLFHFCLLIVSVYQRNKIFDRTKSLGLSSAIFIWFCCLRETYLVEHHAT